MSGGIFGWLDDALFGASPYVPTQRAGVGGGITPTPPGAPGYSPQSSLGGLLDPRGIREQAFYQGLGSLSQGLLAAGLPHPAAQGSLIPQALGAFQPAYSGALSQGYQQANAEQQMRQQQQDEQYLQAYRAANPAYANLPRAALIAQISRTPPTGFEPDPARPGAMRPIVGGPEDLTYRGARATAERDPIVSTPYGPASRDALMPPGGGAVPPTQAPPAGGAQPGGAPPGQPATSGGTPLPVGVRNNNWLSMSPGGRVAQYDTPEVGIAAASQNLDRLFPSGTVTPRQLVQMWAQGPNYNAQTAAPGIRASVENYGTAVARAAGASSPDQPINLQDPATRQRVIEAMGQFETGGLPQGSTAVVARGIALASQPGARFTPAQPRQVAPAGGAAAGAAPAPGGAAAPPAAASPATAPSLASVSARPDGTLPTVPLPEPGADVQPLLRPRPGMLMQGPAPQDIQTASEERNRHLTNNQVQVALRTRTALAAMEDAMTRPTAASDLNLIYGLVSIFDPNSAVMSGEQQSVRSTQGLPDTVRGTIDRVLNGSAVLQPEDRQRIMAEARSRVQANMENYNLLRTGSERLLRGANLNPDWALGPRLTMPAPYQAPEPPRAPPPPATSAATPAGPAQPGAGPGGTGAPAPSPRPAPPAPPPPPPVPPGQQAVPARPSTLTPQEISMLATPALIAMSRDWDALTGEQQDALNRTLERRARDAPPRPR